MSIVKFLQGSKNTLPLLGSDNSTLYFVNDTRELYKSVGANVPLRKIGDVYGGYIDLEDLENRGDKVKDKFYFTNDNKIYRYDGTKYVNILQDAINELDKINIQVNSINNKLKDIDDEIKEKVKFVGEFNTYLDLINFPYSTLGNIAIVKSDENQVGNPRSLYIFDNNEWRFLGKLSSPENFSELDDTPSDYTGNAKKVVKVKETEDGLIFDDIQWLDILNKPNLFIKDVDTTDSLIEGNVNKFMKIDDDADFGYDKTYSISKINAIKDELNEKIDNHESMIVHGNEWHLEEYETVEGAQAKANQAEQNAKDYTDEQITLITETGVPKLNVYEYKFDALVGEQEFIIPLETFDKNTDIVKLYINTTIKDSDFFTVINAIKDEDGNLIEKGKVVLNSPLTNKSRVVVEIWKNIPMGDEGLVSGVVIAPDTLPKNRVIGLEDKLNELSGVKISVGTTPPDDTIFWIDISNN